MHTEGGGGLKEFDSIWLHEKVSVREKVDEMRRKGMMMAVHN
jgi:hypothetical protein